MKRQGRQAGYSLIELLLYVAIVGAILTTVTAFLGITLNARVKNQSISEVNDQGIFAINHIAQVVRDANTITQPALGINGNILTLIPKDSANPVSIYTASNMGAPLSLHLKEGSNAAIQLTNSKVEVTDLIFKNLTRANTNNIVQISFKLSRVNSANRNEYNYQKVFTSTARIEK